VACASLLAEFGKLATQIATFSVTALVLGNNVFRGQERARKHGNAAESYLELERDFKLEDALEKRGQLSTWEDRVLEVRSETPMLNKVLLAVARNAVLREMNTDVLEPTSVHWLKRACAPLVAFFPHSTGLEDSE
jgi:hypothetical protein